jgi:hypothetical protein
MSQYTNIGTLYDDEDADDIFGNATCYGMDMPLSSIPPEMANPSVNCVVFSNNLPPLQNIQFAM